MKGVWRHTSSRVVSAAERQVLDAALLASMGPMAGTHETWLSVAGAMFDVMLDGDERLGSPLEGDWLAHVRSVAQRVCDMCLGVAAMVGGDPLYLPVRGLQHKRDREMLARYNGRNGDSLAREYGITTRRFRQILEDDRRDRLERLQGRLSFD